MVMLANHRVHQLHASDVLFTDEDMLAFVHAV